MVNTSHARQEKKDVNFNTKTDNKYINFLENASSGSSVVSWEQTDGRTDRDDELYINYQLDALIIIYS